MPRAAPSQPSASAMALASLSTTTGMSIASARDDASGKRRQPGMLSGDTVPASMGPPHPTPHPRSSVDAPSRTPRTSETSTSKSADASVVAGVGTTVRPETSPRLSTTAAASLVPPTSTAR